MPGLTVTPVTNLAEVTSLFALGDKNRSQTATNMNEHSSRSHMMLNISISSENIATEG